MRSPPSGAKRVAIRPALFRTRNALLLGFGGLVLLLVISGLDAIQVLSQMRASNEAIRREFVFRSKQLEQIRSALYLSGTYVRDYLLEPDPSAAEHHKASLKKIREQIATQLNNYQRLLRPEQRGPFDILEAELDSYWHSLDPVLGWDAHRRMAGGYAFVRDEVFPRRMNMLGIADRIGIVNEQELTDGEQRVNELFVRFRNRLLAVFGVTVALGILQAAATIRLILRLERQTRLHLDEVTQTRAELRELSAKLVKAQEEERKSISRELHDAVGQSLSAVLFEVDNLAAVRSHDAIVNDHAGRIRRLVKTSIGMLRNIALLLRPSMLDDLGLIPALEWQAREVSRRHGILVNIAAEELPGDLSDEYNTCIYRVVQEALNNIAKHSGAQSVRITVQLVDGQITMSVQDDGKGFEVVKQKGLGLIGIQERVMNMGGTVRVESEPGRGTLLIVTLPAVQLIPKPVGA